MNGPDSRPRAGAFLELGFRPFFLGAALFALVAMLLWAAAYLNHIELVLAALSPGQWHAHEMIFGYAMAVVAGFLLTAVRNWTGQPTLSGPRLALLAGTWAAARLTLMAGTPLILLSAALDLAFVIGLLLAAGAPVLRVRQWRQAGVISKLALFAIANALFYLGVMGVVEHGVRWGLYTGLYLLVSLILTIGGRVIPGFIERGVDYPVRIAHPAWIKVTSLALFIPFFVADVFLADVFPGAERLAGVLAVALAGVNLLRLARWHTIGIWRRPLLWGLYLAMLFIVAGFALYALAVFGSVPKLLAMHAFGLGGVGLATVAMMARVALGHSGRSVLAPPAAVTVALTLMLLAALARVGVPLLAPGYYGASISAAQLLWITAFAVFLGSYWPVLTRPRVDAP